MNRELIKTAGFYILLGLVIARFLVVPLADSVKGRQGALEASREAYLNKLRVFLVSEARAEVKAHVGSSSETAATPRALFPAGKQAAVIQSTMVQEVQGLAEAQGLTFTGFEFMEAQKAGGLSEVSVVVRIKGEAKLVPGFLKALQGQGWAFKESTVGPGLDGIPAVLLKLSAFRVEAAP